MKLNEIISQLITWCPPQYQESYDNAGLITGHPEMEVTGAMLCLDSTEAVINEAIEKKVNLVIAHHPIVFSGLKSITGKTYMERVLIKAIKNDIAIYAAHTNLDNVGKGVNQKIAKKLGLINCSILAPKKGTLKKLFTYIPTDALEKVQNALFEAGAGNIGNYSECSFQVSGTGTFKGNDESTPTLGEKGKRHSEQESKLEVIFPAHLESKLIYTLKENHPYEEVAYEIISLDNSNQDVGSGMIGELETSMSESDFLNYLKKNMKAQMIRHTSFREKAVQRVAICGGSGSFLLNHAIGAKADVFVSADFKYHQFFDADGKILICDIGHFETEQFTQELFHAFLREKFRNFAVHFSTVNTNPVNYY